ncbi:hypothetical protein NQZ68_025880 [Dissostichus eleginoides]|nr:hypothetical protein NQZ68_025880 [Dissostichus eleginoides]
MSAFIISFSSSNLPPGLTAVAPWSVPGLATPSSGSSLWSLFFPLVIFTSSLGPSFSTVTYCEYQTANQIMAFRNGRNPLREKYEECILGADSREVTVHRVVNIVEKGNSMPRTNVNYGSKSSNVE